MFDSLGFAMSALSAVKNEIPLQPNRVFAAILLRYGYNPKMMWKRNGVYGCGNSGFRFYPKNWTFSISRWKTEYVGGQYERNFVDTFYKVVFNIATNSISWHELQDVYEVSA